MVLRAPRLSRDLKDVYFAVPYTATTSRLFRKSLATESLENLGDASDFCVVWGGPDSGSVVVQTRQIPKDASAGILYKCELWKASPGTKSEIRGNCEDFSSSVEAWSLQSWRQMLLISWGATVTQSLALPPPRGTL